MIFRTLFALFFSSAAQCYAQQLFDLQTITPGSVKDILYEPDRIIRLRSLPPVKRLFMPTSLFVSDYWVTANGSYLMMRPDTVCSAYDQTICHNLGDFYKPYKPQIIASALYQYESKKAVTFGINTGFNALKLTVKPSIMLGHANKFYLDEAQKETLIIEGFLWLGGRVEHKPCIDDFDRQYYCPSLSAWSDFSYKEQVGAVNFKLWYQKKF